MLLSLKRLFNKMDGHIVGRATLSGRWGVGGRAWMHSQMLELVRTVECRWLGGGVSCCIYADSLGFPSIMMQWGAFTRARVRVALVDRQQT